MFKINKHHVGINFDIHTGNVGLFYFFTQTFPC